MQNTTEKYNDFSRLLHRFENFITSLTGSDIEHQGQNNAGTKQRPTSLTNDGATCYLNSAFQGISSCNIFVRDIEELSNKYGKGNVKNLHLFIQLMSILNGSSKTQTNISRNAIFRQWNKSGQQDCYELLAYALNQVYNELRSYKESKGQIAKRDLQAWLRERLPMRIIILYTITCACKNQALCPLQSDLALHVTIPMDPRRCIPLGELIDKYFEDDFIEDYDCDKQSCSGNGAKRLARLVRPLPNTICIHLQRSHWDGYKMRKINTKVSFERTLELKESYLYEEDINKKRHAEDDSQHEPAKMNSYVNHCEGFSSLSNEDATTLNGGLSKFEKNGDALTHPQSIEHPNSTVDPCILFQGSSEQTCQLSNVDTEKWNYPHDGKNSDGTFAASFGNLTSSQELVNNKNNVLQAHKVRNDVDDRSSTQSGTRDPCSPSMPEKQNQIDKKYPSLNERNRDEHYRLVSVIVHSGTVSGGHYVCYKRVEEQWYLTDDSYVYEVNESNVLGCNPYVLFYEQNSSSSTQVSSE